MDIKPEVLDELLKGIKTQEDLAGPNGLLKAITKALVERMLDGELTHHLGYEKNDPVGYGSGNSRNGKSRKTLKSEQGELAIETQRGKGYYKIPSVPTGFKGYGVKTRAVKGHEFGLKLTSEDKQALIAFLKTL